jgi:hypothetical protein
VDSHFRGNDTVTLLALQWTRLGAGFLPLARRGWRIHCFVCMRRQGRRHKQRCRRHPPSYPGPLNTSTPDLRHLARVVPISRDR